MSKIFSKEVKIGLAFVVALFLLYYGINFLKGVNVFKKTNSYVVIFDNVSDLSLSSPVVLSGFQIGLVHSMELMNNNSRNVAVTLNLNKGVQIPRDSKMVLDVSLMGNAQVMVESNPYSKEYYSTGDTIKGTRNPGIMESVSQNMIPQLTNLVPKMDSILVGLQTIVNHPALTKSLDNVDIITTELAASSKQLNLMVAKLNKDVPVIADNMVTVTNDLTSVSGQFKSMNLASSYSAIDSTLRNLQSLTTRLNSKDNSLGLLLNDKALYDSLNNAVGNASLLLKDVKENPSKYINIKVF